MSQEMMLILAACGLMMFLVGYITGSAAGRSSGYQAGIKEGVSLAKNN